MISPISASSLTVAAVQRLADLVDGDAVRLADDVERGLAERAHRHDQRAGLDPRLFDQIRVGVGDGDDDIGAAAAPSLLLHLTKRNGRPGSGR